MGNAVKAEDQYLAEPREIKLRDGRGLSIRLLGKDDANGIIAFYASIPPEDGIHYTRPEDRTREQAIARADKADNPGEVCLVLADKHGGIHGEAWYRWNPSHPDYSIFGIAIRRTLQGVGAGRFLTKRLLEIGDAYGPPVMTLTAQIENFRAWKLYASVGFEIIKEQIRPVRSDCGEMPEYYMERKMGIVR